MKTHRSVKTTIWSDDSGQKILVDTIQGLPFGILPENRETKITKYGILVCSGHQHMGMGEDMELTEIEFTIKQR